MRLVFAFTVAGLIAFAQERIAVPNTCAIEGTVVDRVTHAPVPRARLVLMAAGANYRADADNSGRWSFSGLRCDNVSVLASRFGYLETQRTTDPPPTFFLTPDAPAHATIELMPQSVITGKVVDENGDPIMGMRVVPYVARVLDGRREPAPAPQAVTDDLGRFRIPLLEPGSYIVCARPPIGELTYEEACYPAALEAGMAAAMRLAPAQETEIDLVLTRVHPVRVSGIVTGAPEGARVGVELWRGSGRGVEPSISTGVLPDGKFMLQGVPPGSYTLAAMTTTPDRHALFGRLPLEVGSTDIDNVSVALEPLIRLPGALRFDTENAPPDFAQHVQIELRSSERNGRISQAAFSGDDGSFTVPDLIPGSYRLSVRPPENYFVASATLGGRDITHGEFDVDSAAGPLEIVLSDKGGSLEGDVLLEDGSPATAAVVILLREGELVRNFRIENGHFNQSNLPPGNYVAYAWESTRNVAWADPEWMKRYAGAGTPVTIAAGRNAQIKLTRQTAPAEY